MGLIIDSLPVMKGLATIENVYVNIRDIRYNKEETEDENSEYTLEFMCYYQRDNKHINGQILRKTFTEFYNGNIWTEAYAVLKQDLTAKGLIHQDV